MPVYVFAKYLRLTVPEEVWPRLHRILGIYREALSANQGRPSPALSLAGAILSICGMISCDDILIGHPGGLRLLSAADFLITQEMVQSLMNVLHAEASGAPEEASPDAINFFTALDFAHVGNENLM